MRATVIALSLILAASTAHAWSDYEFQQQQMLQELRDMKQQQERARLREAYRDALEEYATVQEWKKAKLEGRKRDEAKYRIFLRSRGYEVPE